MSERSYWVGFSVFPGIGTVKFNTLLAHFGSAKDAWHAPEYDLTSVLGEKLTAKFIAFRKAFLPQEYVENLDRGGLVFLTTQDDAYPKQLRESVHPPFVLYVNGSNDFNREEIRIAIVGTRTVSTYGQQVTEYFTRELVQAGCTIVSGLALGVDAIAHAETIAAGGRTIAVLGCGVDFCYPSSNQGIYDAILQHKGAIVSEYPPGTKPTKGSFPSRNRIIAGLSQAVLVTEGAEDSGALITADFAMQSNRKVYAIPGPITSSLSEGPYKLIRKGATLVTKPDVIIKAFIGTPLKNTQGKKHVVGETQEEQKIIELLLKETLLFDELVRRTGMGPATVAVTLSFMEMKGHILNIDGKYALA